MNNFYRTQEAAKTLQTEAVKAREAMASNRTETSQHLADLNVNEATVVECGANRRAWRICVVNPVDGVADEVVFAVQGVVSKANLVPTNVQRMDHRKALRLTQQVEVTGLETGIFEEAMNQMEAAQDIFVQHFSGVSVTKLCAQTIRGGRTLGASNRLFTLRSDCPTEQGSEFQPGMDPLGSLEKLTSEELFHGPKNIVRFYKRTQNQTTEETTYDTTYPGTFRPGDLVEVHTSMIAIRTGDLKIKVTCRLHAITLLNNVFTKAASIDRISQRSRPVAAVAIRRRGPYDRYTLGSNRTTICSSIEEVEEEA
ncbi:hypothetical protein B0H16DRAFT_1716488 [Mycena metata]|uniref:Uncharacterized protein n=1 Tax=Mycena metata TaxID=1033252 RepID=A0AAD7JNC8_9AGAR|nr:hypothetical protein B0H16DRAFT_1716488 [Mycena metata]